MRYIDFLKRRMTCHVSSGYPGDGQKEYIETDGNCWIVTDIPVSYIPNIVSSFYLSSLPTNTSGQRILYTYGDSQTNNATHLRFQKESDTKYVFYSITVSSSGYRQQRYVTAFSSNTATYFSVKVTGSSDTRYSTTQTLTPSLITTSVSGSASGNVTKQDAYLSVFGDNVGTGTQTRALYSGSRCYGIDIYSDTAFTTLQYSLRPWQYLGEPGLYDTINHRFYGNSGTGTLSCSAT